MNTTATDVSRSDGRRRAFRDHLVLLGIAAALTIVAELIGAHEFSVGIGTLSLFPLIWGILLGGAVGLQKVKPLPAAAQRTASLAVQVGVLLLASRLAFVVGENLSVLAEVGPALLLQELGNLFTIFIGLPVAILFGLRRSAVGATFSICREGAFVIVGERFGAESDERRGVLAMYVFGTVLGALYVSLLASMLAGTGWFNPLALAMGAGVGSGSVMAASSASIAAQYPEAADQVLTLAAVSNLLSSALGLYVGVYIALPLADKLYRMITRDKSTAKPRTGGPVADDSAEVADSGSGAPASSWTILVLVAVAMLVSVWTFDGGPSAQVLPGLLVIVALTAVSLIAKQKLGISSLVVAMTLGMLLATPWSPVSGPLLAVVEPVNFLPLTTPILVFAGLGLAKDAHVLRKIGLRIVPIGLLVYGATFVASAVIAHVALSLG
ncbi:DUF3100 domain-containing protein [Saccharopolyspora griseoalba]|uniref:DUF3100 domain-containing protein n=1 Tax=Saccharopolyspora griseoalba TaxID=1431848 RepID=A0ABW2LNY9_9PSEU